MKKINNEYKEHIHDNSQNYKIYTYHNFQTKHFVLIKHYYDKYYVF
jgi:hypothetical protein